MPHVFRICRGIASVATALLLSQGASAEYLIVSFRDGTTTSFDLEDRPVVSLQSPKMIIRAGSVEAEYDSDSVETFVIGDPGGTAPVLAKDEIRLTYRDRNNAGVSGLDPGSSVILYSIDGKAIATTAADSEGSAWLDLSGLAKGSYIISITNGQSFKIIR